MLSADSEISAPICSRADCSETATWDVIWRNPRIHDESRQKIWLACPDHVVFLRDYLAARDFPVRTQEHSK